MKKIELGKTAPYADRYDASLLEPIIREDTRKNLEGPPVFYGEDRWTAYELSWLDKKGKPLVFIAEFIFSAASPAMVESKSFKYYLNSFNQSRFASPSEVVEILRRDLAQVAQAPVHVELYSISAYQERRPLGIIPGECLDDLTIDVLTYQPQPSVLQQQNKAPVEREALYSHLLKSNCPVTDQPDWATLWLCYSGRPIVKESLLAYIISFREHQGFHENCVETVFSDLMHYCELSHLEVYAAYTRRGGLDINPYRSKQVESRPPNVRLARQ